LMRKTYNQGEYNLNTYNISYISIKGLKIPH